MQQSSYSNYNKKRIDWITILLYAILVGFGWLNLYAANYNPESDITFATDTEYFKQLVWICVTMVCVGVIMLVDSKMIVEISYIVYYASIFLLVVVLLFGKEVNGAKAWLAIGPVSFQPVEFTKIGTALVVARIMSRYNFTFETKSYAKLFAVLFVPIILVLLQNDTGSALIFTVFLLPMYREGMSPHVLIICATCAVAAIASLLLDNDIVMLVIVGIVAIANGFLLVGYGLKRNALISILTCVVMGGAFYLVMYMLGKADAGLGYGILVGALAMTVYVVATAIIKRLRLLMGILGYMWIGLMVAFATGYIFENVLIAHQRTRINILFGIEEDPLGAGYNVNQSLIAIGSGGFTGKGFLEGTQTKLNFVPKQTTDFIFCTVGEEWGYAGSAGLILIYVFFFMRLISLAEKQHSVFSRAYGYCVVSIFFFHFAVNISMTIGLMPVIGIPLPFFSYGGSSLWGFSMLLFLFLKLDTDRNELIR